MRKSHWWDLHGNHDNETLIVDTKAFTPCLVRGSWVVVNLLASDIADDFQCGAISSPSIDMEEKVYGGSVPELMSRMNRPILLMPTRVRNLVQYTLNIAKAY